MPRRASSVFVGEMLVGRFVLDGADPAAATDLSRRYFGNSLCPCGSATVAWLMLQGSSGVI